MQTHEFSEQRSVQPAKARNQTVHRRKRHEGRNVDDLKGDLNRGFTALKAV
jgi:hypothetical protein